jgi:hypothetical protein
MIRGCTAPTMCCLCLLLVGACSPLNRETLRAFTAQGVRANIQDKAVAKELDLRMAVNFRGEGVLVYARGKGTDCEPEYLWLHLGNRIYAVDDSARALTPELRLYREAAEADVKRSGIRLAELESGARAFVCPTGTPVRGADPPPRF